MDLIDKCLRIALIAHQGQKDKLGNTYILHPLSVVMQNVICHGYSAMCVALLHDVIQDTEIDSVALKYSDVPVHIIKSVEILTKLKNERYVDYIIRIILSNDKDALLVKRADLLHNLSLSRESGIPKGKKSIYENALNNINYALKKLNPQRYYPPNL